MVRQQRPGAAVGLSWNADCFLVGQRLTGGPAVISVMLVAVLPMEVVQRNQCCIEAEKPSSLQRPVAE
jgi:hypothetical protein